MKGEGWKEERGKGNEERGERREEAASRNANGSQAG